MEIRSGKGNELVFRKNDERVDRCTRTGREWWKAGGVIDRLLY